MRIGELITISILPETLVAPLFPLLLVLLKKEKGIRQSTFLLSLLASVNLVSGIFLYIAADSIDQQLFSNLAFSLQIIFSALLLRGCTDQLLLQQIIWWAISIFTASILTSLALMPNGNLTSLIQSGFFVLFLTSVAVLYTHIGHATSSLLKLTEFWYTAGIFFFYGLFTIIMFIPQVNAPIISNLIKAFIIICYLIQTLLFCLGIVIQKTKPFES